MCTVTWIHQEDGYQLFCNRDEKRTRSRAFAPRVESIDGVRIIAPVDADSGGTWIAANEFDVSLCLLNGPAAGTPRLSRGLLVLDLITAQSVAEVTERIWHRDLSPFAPFTLAALAPNQEVTIQWNGVEKTNLPITERFLTSSSFDPEGVAARRRDEFRRRCARPDADQLFAFHRSHGSGPDAYSTCMHRQDAETVSFSWIKVTEDGVKFIYSPAAPCKRKTGTVTNFACASRHIHDHVGSEIGGCLHFSRISQ